MTCHHIAQLQALAIHLRRVVDPSMWPLADFVEAALADKAPDTVAQAIQILAQLNEDQAKRAQIEAKRLRNEAIQRRRDEALRRVYRDYLSDLGPAPAAEEISRAALGYRAPRSNSAEAQATAKIRPQVRRQLEQLLGGVGDIPGPSRIRQIIDNARK